MRNEQNQVVASTIECQAPLGATRADGTVNLSNEVAQNNASPASCWKHHDGKNKTTGRQR